VKFPVAVTVVKEHRPLAWGFFGAWVSDSVAHVRAKRTEGVGVGIGEGVGEGVGAGVGLGVGVSVGVGVGVGVGAGVGVGVGAAVGVGVGVGARAGPGVAAGAGCDASGVVTGRAAGGWLIATVGCCGTAARAGATERPVAVRPSSARSESTAATTVSFSGLV
jgi:hypothetical protein